MKKIVYVILATLSGLVLLLSYRTSLGEGTAPPPAPLSGSSTTGGSTSGSTTNGSTSGGSTTNGSTSGGSSSSNQSPAGLTAGTYTGQSADTRYGPIQVQIVVSNGQITGVTVPDYPMDNPRDAEINQQAIPQLVSETLSAQSAGVDMISGATYTTDGYVQSLQSAIDQAKG